MDLPAQSVSQSEPGGIQSDLQQLVAKIPWVHNILLIEKVNDPKIRFCASVDN